MSAGDMQQMTLFDLLEQESDFPCNNCVFDKKGRCSHIEDEECFCVRGSFQIRPRDIVCPQCGKTMEVTQSCFGSDGARCRCGAVKVFNNRGNRKTALELWREGRLVGI